MAPTSPFRLGRCSIAVPLTGLFTFGLMGCGLLQRGEAKEDEAVPAEAKADAATPPGDESNDETVEDVEATDTPLEGIDRYKRWSPLHPFINAPVVRGVAVSSTEAMVLTKDNHIGVTTDAGKTWHFHRLRNGWATDIDGFAGGPFVAVGGGGYVAMSDNGRHWRDLPRYTSDDLLDVVASELGTVAVGKRGSYVRYDKDGSTADGGLLPDKFKAKAVFEQNGAVVALAGKKAYGTVDGETWTRFEQDLDIPNDKVALTQAGACSLGKVGKNKGVVCSVTGTAYGLSDGYAAVEKNGIVAVSSDGGKSWKTSSLPFKGAQTIFGREGGSLFATGSGGAIATSRNGGKSWIDLEWEDTATLNSGFVDGENVLIVGDKTTIAYSKNGGKTWSYAEPEFTANFDYATKVGDKYVITDGRIALSSTDMATWVEELEDLPELPGKPEACSELPEPRVACRFASGLTTPEGMPSVRGFSFSGDVGVAYGDDGLTAFTRDGGASWSTEVGLGLGALRMIDVHEDIVVVSDGSASAVSTDGGETFAMVQTPTKVTLYDIMISDAGQIYAAGKSGTLLRSSADPTIWLPVQKYEKDKTNFVQVFEVANTFFAAGAKGELWRSVDGNEWLSLDLGRRESVQAMAGEKDTVYAVTLPSRNGSNMLLRSDDAGEHFRVITEMSHAGRAYDFELAGNELRYRDRVSTDGGLSWQRGKKRYWAGAEPLEDGSGKSIIAYPDRYGKDPLYIVQSEGGEDDDWTIIDGTYSEGAMVRCSGSAGCWMIAGGTLYKPN